MILIKIVTLVGIPTTLSFTIWCFKQCQRFKTQLDILMSAQKAQMRQQLIDLYHKYDAQEFITDEQLEEWENQYKAYHALVGENGVLDARRERLLNKKNIKEVQID